VWQASLESARVGRHDLLAVLSPEERKRASSFVFERDRHRYVMAHSALRVILAGYLGAAPASLAFVSKPGGKPRLASPRMDLRFNLSHSADRILVAVARGREIGVDIEMIRDIPGLDDLAESCFSPAERRWFAAVQVPTRLGAFFDGWTRKEAFLKASGEGLSRALDSFDVTLLAGDAPRLLRLSGGRASDWTLRALDAGPGYRAALAVEGPLGVLEYLDWSSECERRPAPHGAAGSAA
jgi:4'-phosphopantetheinyl transferase